MIFQVNDICMMKEDNLVVEAYLAIGEEIKRRGIDINMINARGVNANWSFLMGEMVEPYSDEYPFYYYVYFVEKGFFEEEGFIKDSSLNPEIDNGKLVIPTGFDNECMDSCFPSPDNMKEEDVKELLKQWGFTEVFEKDMYHNREEDDD